MKRLALLFVIFALLPGVSSAQGPLELNAEGEMFGDEGPGLITFQYPDEWEFVVETDGYLVSRASLLDDFEFDGEDMMLVFTEFTYQAYDHDYNVDTDPVEYIRAIIDEDIADGLDVLSSEDLTIGGFNVIHEVYEQDNLQANVFGMYEDGNQPIVLYTVGLPDTYAAYEETILAILETVTFNPAYDPFIEALNEFVASADISNAQSLVAEGEPQAISLTVDDEFMAFTYEAEADSLAFFRVNETSATDDDIAPSILIIDPEGNVFGNAGSTRTSSSTVDGDPLSASYSQIVAYFDEAGMYTLLVGVNGVFDGYQEPAAADFEIYYLPVTEVSGVEPIEVEHTSGQTHLFVTDEVFAGELFITASTADNTGLNLQVAALYLDGDTINMGNTSFAFGEPDSTVLVSVDVYNAPDEGQPGRVVIMVSEEALPREGELIPGVETTLTITIEQKS